MEYSFNFDVLEHLPSGICVINKDFRVIFWNETIEYWTKLKKSDILGRDLRKQFPKLEDIQYTSRINDLFIGGPPVIFSSQIHHNIFTSFNHHNILRYQNIVVSAIPNDYDNSFFAMFVVTDVTETTLRFIENIRLKTVAEKRAHEISELNIHLKETNNQKDKFFSIISHDLKSPFNGFMGLLKMLTENFNDFEKEEVYEMLDMLFKSAKSVWELLETLLDWARSQTGKMPFKPEIIEINAVLENQLYLFKTLADNKKINLKTELLDNQLVGHFDYKMIDTVIRNLVSNSLKFTYENGTVLIRAASYDDDFIIISVIDDGMGIPPESLAKLFRLDTQVTTLGTSEEKGTGLGLILCKDFVEKNGGKIWVESEVGKGTNFSITIKKAQEIEFENV